ncbi:hypothetical protein ADIWIN_1805 [Winogradskyella psychrotolerans RS-3]|uniref:Uncharacterized protein n=1 Tax=Winogradskyella psychrotolerans RS-3 TaxID=641526 RepID=S7X1X2_9FLAO|nr:hypothetical protein [Winogradskyella psychrotolerans]EPR73024.1 hypothetical protein ADIWIN_1805 [Winogradskyella psychrotolerans RS-3]
MLQNILNLEGVTVLGKTQQGAINGGGSCRLTTLTNNDSEEYIIMGGSVGETAESQTAAAQQACGQLLENADRCFYDCSHDGPG